MVFKIIFIFLIRFFYNIIKKSDKNIKILFWKDIIKDINIKVREKKDKNFSNNNKIIILIIMDLISFKIISNIVYFHFRIFIFNWIKKQRKMRK